MLNAPKFQYMMPILLVLLSFSRTPNIICLPQGAPERVCDTMLPFHGGGILPSDSVSPYRLEVPASIVGQGQSLRVDIVGVHAGLEFGGFMLQAQNGNPPHQIIGQFNPTLVESVKLMNCENSVNNSATHSNVRPKTVISLEWKSPIDFLGQVVFKSTVAQSYSSFWVGVPSHPVEVVKREVLITDSRVPQTPSRVPYVPQPESPHHITIPEDPFYTNCGLSKTCFGYPNGCLEQKTCKSISAVKVRGDIYEFEMRSDRNGPAYVALGLSEDDKMGDDLVIECVPQNGKINLYSSYTTGNPNYGTSRIGVPQNRAKLLQASFIDGVIYCKVQPDSVANVKNKMFDLINSKYHLLLASGSSIKENGVGYHDLGRLQSSTPINLAVVQDLSGSSTLLLRLHGAFMVIAWIGTTSLGIVLARYFKQTWVGKQSYGKDQWFVWHRVCMVTTWSLTTTAFILIFSQIGTWSAERNPHAILGTITTILAFIQPIGALFRPTPSSKNRLIFNWAHWLVGNLAHILAIVTIFFSVELAKAELPEWTDWILVAYVIFNVIVHLIYSIAGCRSDQQHLLRVDTFQMSDMGTYHHRNGIKKERKKDAPYAGFRKVLLAVYTIVLVLMVITLVLIVVLSPIEEIFKDMQY